MKKVELNILFSKENLAFESLTPLVDFVFQNNINLIEEYYEFARYLNPEFEKLVKNPKLSITSATSFKERIRFTHYTKIYYVFNFLIDSIINKSKNDSELLEINFYNCHEMLESDVMFVDHFIERIKNKEITISLKFQDVQPKLQNVSFIKENLTSKIIKFTYKSFWDKDNKEKMFERAMNLFLFEDGIRLGKELFDSSEDTNQKCFIADKLGIAHVLYDQQTEGEKYYNYVMEQPCDPAIKVSVLYKLSMLYLRHHPIEKRDEVKAEEYLLTAKNVIENEKDQLGEDYIFHKVFNRNGYSLVLFKKGDIETAHLYCVEGNELILNEYGPTKHILHRSVLIYNSTLTSSKMNKIEQAQKQFDYLLEMDPYYSNYWLARAEFYKRLGEFDKSIEDYSQAIKLNPYSDGLYCARGIVYETIGDLKKAEEDYLRALDLNPNHTDSIMNYGVRMLDENKLEQSLLTFKKLSQLEVENKHNVYNNIGLVYLEQDKLDQAIESFDESIKYKADFAIAYANKAIAHFNKNENTDALQSIEAAIRLEDNLDYVFNRAYLFNAIGEFDKSLSDIEMILKQNPKNTDALELKIEIESRLEKIY